MYWINPGDSGVPTKVKLHLPEGFKAGEVRMPVPVKFDQPGGVVGHGYERQLFLTAEVTAPAALPESSKITIEAEASWLVCKNVCLPGRVKVSSVLPVSQEPGKANDAVFNEWSERFPRAKDPAVKSAKWKSDAASGTFTQTIKWVKAPRKAEFIPVRMRRSRWRRSTS